MERRGGCLDRDLLVGRADLEFQIQADGRGGVHHHVLLRQCLKAGRRYRDVVFTGRKRRKHIQTGAVVRRAVCTPVAMWIAVTVACGIIPPVGSVMVPWIVPLPAICPNAVPAAIARIRGHIRAKSNCDGPFDCLSVTWSGSSFLLAVLINQPWCRIACSPPPSFDTDAECE